MAPRHLAVASRVWEHFLERIRLLCPCLHPAASREPRCCCIQHIPALLAGFSVQLSLGEVLCTWCSRAERAELVPSRVLLRIPWWAESLLSSPTNPRVCSIAHLATSTAREANSCLFDKSRGCSMSFLQAGAAFSHSAECRALPCFILNPIPGGIVTPTWETSSQPGNEGCWICYF